jgi:hypothetical protein
MLASSNEEDKTLKLFRGVPSTLRSVLWPQLTESQVLMESNEGLYAVCFFSDLYNL